MTPTPKALPALPDDIRSEYGPIWNAIHEWREATAGEEAGKAADAIDETVEELMRAYAQQAIADSLASAGGVEDDWLPIALAQEDELCIVFWRDESDPANPERYEFDHLDDGVWHHHNENYEHYMMVGASVGPGPSEKAPYTHFKRLHAPGAQSALSKEREVADGLAEALRGYMAAVDLMNAAMKDGINVHGAISGLIGWTDNAEFALTAHRESRGNK